jgi:hypothetical protein
VPQPLSSFLCVPFFSNHQLGDAPTLLESPCFRATNLLALISRSGSGAGGHALKCHDCSKWNKPLGLQQQVLQPSFCTGHGDTGGRRARHPHLDTHPSAASCHRQCWLQQRPGGYRILGLLICLSEVSLGTPVATGPKLTSRSQSFSKVRATLAPWWTAPLTTHGTCIARERTRSVRSCLYSSARTSSSSCPCSTRTA